MQVGCAAIARSSVPRTPGFAIFVDVHGKIASSTPRRKRRMHGFPRGDPTGQNQIMLLGQEIQVGRVLDKAQGRRTPRRIVARAEGSQNSSL